MNHHVYCKFNLTTNFSPNLTKDLYSYSFLTYKKLKKVKILCKNLIIFILCVREAIFFDKRNLGDWKFKFYTLPTHKTLYTLLRAPYRYKLAKNQLMFKRYNFLFSAKKLINPPQIININQAGEFLNYFIISSGFFETNIAYQKKSSIKFPVKCSNYFKYNI